MAELVQEQPLPDPDCEPGQGTPLVVVVSPQTLRAVEELAAAGWSGPVLMVGTVGEAQQVFGVTSADDAPAPAETPRQDDREPLRGSVRSAVGIQLDPDRQLLVCGERDCALTPLEYGVLESLREEPGKVRRFADLTRRVWGVSHVGDGAQVHAVVRRVRRKLELVAAPVQILAVRGIGFRLVPDSPTERRRLVVAD